MTDKGPTIPGSSSLAAGQAAGVTFAARATGAMLDVTWTNAGPTALKLATHVFAGEKHFDWITVELTPRSGAPRKLQFLDDRDESGAVVVDVAPGASVSETIDLASWAARKANGGTPLAPGTYRAQVVYDSQGQNRGWVGRLEAATTVAIP